MKIRLIGQRNNFGIGVHYTNFADALRKLSHWGVLVEEISFEDQDVLLAAAATSKPDDINICFVSIPLQHHFRGTNIQWVVFESTRVPPNVMSTMLTADVVWVPSAWGRTVLIQNGLDPERCDVVPEGVDTDQFHPWHPSPDDGVFRYLLTCTRTWIDQCECVVWQFTNIGHEFVVPKTPGVCTAHQRRRMGTAANRSRGCRLANCDHNVER